MNNLVSMDFNEIKESLKTYLRQQDEFTDYDFDGSGMSVLINLLSYDAQTTAYLANMIANESNIDSAILRENVVSRAKIVGYTPHSRKSARAIISVSINDPLNESSSLLLPRGTKFLAGSGSNVFQFVTLNDHNLYLNEVTGLYENTEIEIFEGTIKNVSWTKQEGTRFVINNTSIDTSTLKVGVFLSYNNTAGEYYNRAYSLEKVNSNSNVFWIQETSGNRFEIVFGDGVFGKKPEITNVVYAEYLSTNGIAANGISRFSLIGVFSGYENSQINITTIASSDGGSNSENTESVKINAPRAWSSQGKAVVTEDYEYLTGQLYPYANSVNAWSGAEEYPVKYGKVFISIIPIGGGVVTEYNKRNIERQLASKGVAGITPIIVDANYIYFNLNARVSVKRNSIAQLKQFSNEVRNEIKEFFETKFYKFKTNFYHSNLTTEIENYSRSIASVRLDYELSIKKQTNDLTFDFKNAIQKGTIRSTKVMNSTTNSPLSISDDSNGNITLNDTVIGVVDYDNGLITINNVSSSNNMIEVFVTPLNDDVIVSNRSVIALNESRLSVELISV